MYQLPRIFSPGASIILKILHFITMPITQADAKASTGNILYQPSHVWRIQMKSQFVMNNLWILAGRWMWSRCKQNNNELNLHICFRQMNSSDDYFPWLLFSIWFGGHVITKPRIYCKGFVIETGSNKSQPHLHVIHIHTFAEVNFSILKLCCPWVSHLQWLAVRLVLNKHKINTISQGFIWIFCTRSHVCKEDHEPFQCKKF